jgi:hypothetical protein
VESEGNDMIVLRKVLMWSYQLTEEVEGVDQDLHVEVYVDEGLEYCIKVENASLTVVQELLLDVKSSCCVPKSQKRMMLLTNRGSGVEGDMVIEGILL